MPAKRRTSKSKRFPVTPEAAARWREAGPDAIAERCICDDELAEALGLQPLLAMSDDDLAELRAALNEAAGIAHAD
jgi:hypothetical protein